VELWVFNTHTTNVIYLFYTPTNKQDNVFLTTSVLYLARLWKSWSESSKKKEWGLKDKRVVLGYVKTVVNELFNIDITFIIYQSFS